MTDLVKPDTYQIMTQAEDLRDIIEANVGDNLSQFDLDRITMPSGGGLAWTVPSLTGDEESVKALEGIIVHWKEPRAYWKQSFEDSDGSPPDCTSEDSVMGRGLFGPGSEHNPSGECAECPMSQFGSRPGDSNAQACKQMRVLFMVQPESLLPQAVMLPPTSIKPMKRYFLRLASRAIPFYGVVTRLELERATSGGGIKYSVVKPTVSVQLAPEAAARVRHYGDGLKSVLDAQIGDAVSATMAETYSDHLD